MPTDHVTGEPFAPEKKGLGPFPKVYLSLLDGITKYLGIAAIFGTILFYVNRNNPSWIFPWALIAWLWFIVFNVSYTAFIRRTPKFVPYEMLRVIINHTNVILLFFLTGGAQENFWLPTAICTLGTSTTLFLATGNIRWNSMGFIILYLILYVYDRGLNAQTLVAFVPILLILVPTKLALIRVAQLLKRQYLQMAIEHKEMLQAQIEREQARNANQAKSQFLAHINHELRTPLTAITGFTELLGRDEIQGEQRAEFIKIIRRNLKHLKNIISDMLDLSKIEAGELLIEKDRVDLEKEVREIIAFLSHSASKKGVSLLCDLPDHLPETVVTDITRLRQILFNLIGNAIKFTISGEVRLTLTIELNAADGSLAWLCCRVTDTGVGIPESMFESIFDFFTQVKNAAGGPSSGTGLGLGLSRKLARALGGDLKLITSRENEGSEFEVKIPVHISQDGKDDLSHENKELESAEAENKALKDFRILIAEDNPDTQLYLSTLITNWGAEVVQAYDGRDALAAFDRQIFDLVLMDLDMPNIGGCEATSQLRRRGIQSPIIAFTAHAVTDALDEALNAGCDGFLTKPVDEKVLFDTVAHFRKTNRRVDETPI